MKETKDCLHKRVLIEKIELWGPELKEAIILELSPGNENVKVRWEDKGKAEWLYEADKNWKIVDILETLKVPRKIKKGRKK